MERRGWKSIEEMYLDRGGEGARDGWLVGRLSRVNQRAAGAGAEHAVQAPAAHSTQSACGAPDTTYWSPRSSRSTGCPSWLHTCRYLFLPPVGEGRERNGEASFSSSGRRWQGAGMASRAWHGRQPLLPCRALRRAPHCTASLTRHKLAARRVDGERKDHFGVRFGDGAHGHQRARVLQAMGMGRGRGRGQGR